jgi:hypothetical protein
MTRSMAQPGRDEDRIIRLANQPVPSPSPRPSYAKCGRTAKSGEDHYDDHQQLRTHLADFIAAYYYGRRLKTLRGLTPFEAVRKAWTAEPERFRLDPLHQMPEPNI